MTEEDVEITEEDMVDFQRAVKYTCKRSIERVLKICSDEDVNYIPSELSTNIMLLYIGYQLRMIRENLDTLNELI